MLPDNFKLTPEELRALFHRLWTKAVGTPDYDKKEWQALGLVVDPPRAAIGVPEGYECPSCHSVYHHGSLCKAIK